MSVSTNDILDKNIYMWHRKQVGGQEPIDHERLDRINAELDEQSDPTDADQKYWKTQFQAILSDNGRLNKADLLGTYDLWWQKLKVALLDERLLEFDREVIQKNHQSTEAFLQAVVRFFDIHELYKAEVV